MEDIKAASTRLILSSAGLILFLGGWASFADSIPLGNLGLKLTSLYVAPIILIAFWLFSWQRFFVLARQSNKPSIDQMIVDRVNSSKLVKSVFPPKSFNFPGAVGIYKWAWHHESILRSAPSDYVSYKRERFKRRFMFHYLGNDSNDTAINVHFGPVATNIKNGDITPLTIGYWKCIWFEIRTLAPRFFDTPIIGFHYFPHIFAWAAFIYVCIWL
ncbi:MAG: hypothetical protein LKJ78_21625 [Serratia liquefaciens]|jgi:hypothetical protein|nr:hypothetical protein [Serratia liquefaciens]MCH4262393.1 hypothetical protein [Serratia liquefaciens]MCI1215353.1 hypothetical protein [Serratia liquefaciens]MCI1236588.1 hypothetical protein [Serratia liquefaciens]MCI1252226.1 hypothetical protein [Serratia liquefaciens]